MLAGPLLVAAGSRDDATLQAAPAPSATAATSADLLASLRARDEASASRGLVREAPASAEAAEPAPSQAPAPAPEPSAPPAPPEPAPPAEPPAVTATLWATSEVNVRQGPSSDTERVGYLSAVDQVGATGTTQDGWTQVVLDGVVGWVNSSYLSTTEPVPEAEPEPEAAPEAAAVSDAPCSISTGIESSLTSNARAVYRAVCAAHGGSVSSFGGLRPGDDGDHGSGRAVDIMVSGEPGWEIARYLQARAGELGISYLIYEQQYWEAGSPAGAWEWMEDRGDATANHYDHVHVSVR